MSNCYGKDQKRVDVFVQIDSDKAGLAEYAKLNEVNASAMEGFNGYIESTQFVEKETGKLMSHILWETVEDHVACATSDTWQNDPQHAPMVKLMSEGKVKFKPEVFEITSRSNLAHLLTKRYYDGWTTGDFDQTRAVLADDLKFRGAIDRFDRAEDLVAAVKEFHGIMESINFLHGTVDGQRTHVLYECETKVGPVRFSESFKIAGGKIAEIDLVFDPTPFKQLAAD